MSCSDRDNQQFMYPVTYQHIVHIRTEKVETANQGVSILAQSTCKIRGRNMTSTPTQVISDLFQKNW